MALFEVWPDSFLYARHLKGMRCSRGTSWLEQCLRVRCSKTHRDCFTQRYKCSPFFSLFLFPSSFSSPFFLSFFLGGRGGYRYKTPHLTSSPLKEQSIHLKHRCSVVLTATQHALRCRPEDPLCYTDASFSGICCFYLMFIRLL